LEAFELNQCERRIKAMRGFTLPGNTVRLRYPPPSADRKKAPPCGGASLSELSVSD
jgi:hypothetical protein